MNGICEWRQGVNEGKVWLRERGMKEGVEEGKCGLSEGVDELKVWIRGGCG